MRILLLLMLVFTSCTQMKTRREVDESQVSEQVKIVLNQARDLIKEAQAKNALLKLVELKDESLTPTEKSLKYNLKGVALFNINDIEKAILNFEVAEKYAPRDTVLFSQVELNLASGHFKMNRFNELYEHLKKIDKKSLSNEEMDKYAQLALAFANQTQNNYLIVSSSLLLLKNSKSFEEIVSSTLYPQLKDSFSKLTQSEKIALLEEFNNSKNLAVAHLAQLEAEERYISGDRSGASDVVSWLKSEFGGNEEVNKFIKDFVLRIDNASSINTYEIGLILPLTGDKASFGQKAQVGIETGLKVLEPKDEIKIHVKDSVDNPELATKAVLELIQEKKVSFIIGGLFPETAKAEYLEARKYGVLYVSLSQINLPKEEKNHHLIEVQGSVESQVEVLLSDDMIKKFGQRLGIIYPDNEAGKSYIDEIWRRSVEKNVQITSVSSFQKNTHDYRDTAQLFLGLKYPRERSEELKILDDVYSLEKSSIRRVQTLPPIIDFDWLFLATYPHEATQLIQTLGYYDATRLKVVGGPSWVSKSLVKEQKNLGTLFFVGDDPKDINQDLLTKFQQLYGKPAGLIELLSLDAIKIIYEALLISGQVSNRHDFDSKLKMEGKLNGLSTHWEFKDGLWLKKMNAMTITQGEIEKLF